MNFNELKFLKLISELSNIVQELDDLTSASSTHGHSNKTVLDALSDSNGVLQYNGEPIQGGSSGESVEWDNVQGKPTFATVAMSGSYNDLSDLPIIPAVPSSTTQLTNDSSFVSSVSATSIVILTQEEYDTLPGSKTTDNILYLIKG
jgi:hypothetical protein